MSHSNSTQIAVAPVKTLAEIFLFLHNNTSAATPFRKRKFSDNENYRDYRNRNRMILHFPPPKRLWTAFSRPNSLFNWLVTGFDFSSTKKDTDFFFETLSASVSTMSTRFSAVDFSGIVPMLQESTKIIVKKWTWFLCKIKSTWNVSDIQMHMRHILKIWLWFTALIHKNIIKLLLI